MRLPSIGAVLLPVWLLAGAGCSGDDAPPAADGAAGATSIDFDPSLLPYAPCPADAEAGEFSIDLAAEYTSVSGKVHDGVKPGLVSVELMAEGVCRLLTWPEDACNSSCARGTQECAADGGCIEGPPARDVGVVKVAGMAAAVEMTANARTKNYSNPALPPLPHPGFEAGAALALSAAGGELEAFELRGWGVTLLELTSNPIDVRTGTATSISWVVPDEAGPAHIFASLNIDLHGGGADTWIECDAPDTGSLEIPAALVDALFESGRSGDPTIVLARQSATSANIAAGCVELLVRSELREPVVVEGVTSCRVPDDCPSGQSCTPILRICE